MKSMHLGIAVLTGVMMLGSSGIADTPSEPPMDAEMAAKMERMHKLMTPNENHQVLEAFVGKWAYTGSFKMGPDAPAETMTGIMESELVYGGRFLKQDITGPWMGETFEGLGFIGYDNVKGAYISTWLDNVATGIMMQTGEYDAATKTLKLAGTCSCPMTGEKDRFSRSEWTVIDADHNTYSSYNLDSGGKEFKGMEISYSRVK